MHPLILSLFLRTFSRNVFFLILRFPIETMNVVLCLHDFANYMYIVTILAASFTTAICLAFCLQNNRNTVVVFMCFISVGDRRNSDNAIRSASHETKTFITNKMHFFF